ncbi:MAG: diaminopimelate epimerase [Dehalococcoidia bacterium]|nr:diaminopimelate epimerase [Dehalococcoidia bacterium]
MDFVKMHGTGNDFVLLDARTLQQDWPALAIKMCHRHFGVGADGILLIAPSKRADYLMRMFNPDGSESEMCGNGIRCFAKYVMDGGLLPAKRTQMTVETLAGIQQVAATLGEDGLVQRVRVGMGAPRFTPKDIPVAANGAARIVDHPLHVEGGPFHVTCLSMGNPHAVAFLDQPVDQVPLEAVGPRVEHHAFFPRRVNFSIVNVLGRSHLKMRVWERGAGLTLACGSGACAVAVAAQIKGLAGPSVDIDLPGGTLRVDWDGAGQVWLEGPAELVFRGHWPDR